SSATSVPFHETTLEPVHHHRPGRHKHKHHRTTAAPQTSVTPTPTEYPPPFQPLIPTSSPDPWFPPEDSSTAAPTANPPTPEEPTPSTSPIPWSTAGFPKPTPAANLTAGDYVVVMGGRVCVKVRMALQIRMEYTTSEGTFTIQPADVDSVGICNDTNAEMTLVFKQGVVSFYFERDNSSDMVLMSVCVCSSDRNQLTHSAKNGSLRLFGAVSGHSYLCSSQTVFVGRGVSLEVTQVQVQALTLNNQNFGPADTCPTDKPDNTVIIAVGSTLALMVIAVLTYCISKRRRLKGYKPL
uniref:Lysosome-associated membrane glycoprotein 2-like luminal domain-containing protein n=1 Tax=Denticeps clupeoides TaxID=299321 RepID=A0AAY4DRJ0_9TELE